MVLSAAALLGTANAQDSISPSERTSPLTAEAHAQPQPALESLHQAESKPKLGYKPLTDEDKKHVAEILKFLEDFTKPEIFNSTEPIPMKDFLFVGEFFRVAHDCLSRMLKDEPMSDKDFDRLTIAYKSMQMGLDAFSVKYPVPEAQVNDLRGAYNRTNLILELQRNLRTSSFVELYEKCKSIKDLRASDEVHATYLLAFIIAIAGVLSTVIGQRVYSSWQESN